MDVDVVVVDELVDFVGGDARLDEGGNVIKGFGGKAAEFAHFLDLFGGFDDDGHDFTGEGVGICCCLWCADYSGCGGLQVAFGLDGWFYLVSSERIQGASWFEWVVEWGMTGHLKGGLGWVWGVAT